MRAKRSVASLAILFSVLATAAVWAAEPTPEPSAPPTEHAPPASVTIIGAKEAHGTLGRDVRSAANEDMGHIVDVIVDRSGTVRAAVIERMSGAAELAVPLLVDVGVGDNWDQAH